MIKATNISKKFEDKIIFNNLSFEFKSGSLNVIYGSSGSGKSTLLNCLALLDNCEGEVEILDKNNLKPLSKKVIGLYKNDISYLSQTPILIYDKTVAQNLNHLTTIQAKKIRILLKQLNLLDLENQTVTSLSGGQQQRLAIAIALIKESKIIFADEPTGNVDIKNRDIIIQLLEDAKNQGCCVVIVSHDQYIINKGDTKLCLD